MIILDFYVTSSSLAIAINNRGTKYMLIELKVSHFAIIDNLHIEFKKGLNILSGETGAGKSVLLKCLSLLMGGKASSETIRTGEQQAVVEGLFDLTDRDDIVERLKSIGVDCEDSQLIVRRLISQGDKSRVYLNNCLSSLGSLRDVVAPLIEVTGHSAPLIEMTGQHENRNLISKSYHLDLLDQFSGTWDSRHQFEILFERYQKLQNKILELEAETKSKAQRLDFLVFQRDEISALELAPGEDIELEGEVKRHKNTSKLNHFVNQSESVLYSDDDSVMSRLDSILRKSNEAILFDPGIEEKIEPLRQAKELIDSCLFDLRGYVSKIDADPYRLEKLEQRLSDLRKLQKKYGPSVDDILKSLLEIETEIGHLQNSESQIEDLKKEVLRLQGELKKQAELLHEKRLQYSEKLAKLVNLELLDLNMKGVTFHVSCIKLDGFTSTGISDVEFMSQTSSKDAKRPLAKFASGGELSRILLSLKKVVGASEYPRTYLFDEVDTGVSGLTAEKVGKKLKVIAQGQQVICVTHLPQVAAFGDVHFYIEKSPDKESVSMMVSEIKTKKRIEEIARLISGEKITKTSLAHAQQLIEEAKSMGSAPVAHYS